MLHPRYADNPVEVMAPRWNIYGSALSSIDDGDGHA
jgi:hypothetical protein